MAAQCRVLRDKCHGIPQNFTNCATEFGKICHGKTVALIIKTKPVGYQINKMRNTKVFFLFLAGGGVSQSFPLL